MYVTVVHSYGPMARCSDCGLHVTCHSEVHGLEHDRSAEHQRHAAVVR